MEEQKASLQDAIQDGFYGEYLTSPMTNKQRIELIGRQLMRLRMRSNRTQKELCQVLGCAPQTYSGYEKGKHEPPIESLIRLSYLYDVPLKYIAGQKTYGEDPAFDEMEAQAEEEEYLDYMRNDHMATLAAEFFDIKKEMARIKEMLESSRSNT